MTDLTAYLATLRHLSEEMSLELIERGDEYVHELHGRICDITRSVEAHITLLTQERDARIRDYADTEVRWGKEIARREAAEQEMARLTEALSLKATYVAEAIEQREAAERALADYRDDVVAVMNEECDGSDDRKHCTCVPPLRRALADTRKALAFLWEHYLLPITDEQKAQIESMLAAPQEHDG